MKFWRRFQKKRLSNAEAVILTQVMLFGTRDDRETFELVYDDLRHKTWPLSIEDRQTYSHMLSVWVNKKHGGRWGSVTRPLLEKIEGRDTLSVT